MYEARQATTLRQAASLGAIVVSSFGALAQCSSGSNGASPPLAGDGGQSVSTTVRDAGTPEPTADGAAAADVAAPPPRVPCDSSGSCAAPDTCCGGYCTNVAKDPANCGKCGTACTASQFCTGAACDEAIVANVCDNAMGTVAIDPYAEDNEAGTAMGAALSTSCTPPVSILQTSQNAEGVLEPGTGRPITGPGNTFITGGGGYGQNGVTYMEASITPVYLWSDGTSAQVRTRSTGQPVVSTMVSALTAHHDFFYVQLSIEPKSGTLCFSVAGILSPGTVAGGYFASTELIPNRAKYTASWYVYEWMDTNNDSIPNAGDMFTQVMAGPSGD